MATILIVDDDETDRLRLAAALRPDGHEIVLARDGNEALEVYLAQRVHVVVTDRPQSPHSRGAGGGSGARNVSVGGVDDVSVFFTDLR